MGQLLELAKAIQAVPYELVVEHVGRLHFLADNGRVWQKETGVIGTDRSALL